MVKQWYENLSQGCRRTFFKCELPIFFGAYNFLAKKIGHKNIYNAKIGLTANLYLCIPLLPLLLPAAAPGPGPGPRVSSLLFGDFFFAIWTPFLNY